MKRFLQMVIATMSLAVQANCGQESKMAYGFDNIQPSANLTWTRCFDELACSKLEVPLDYSNRGLGTKSIAFIKKSGKNATEQSPNIVIIPGGPGGSGISLLLDNLAITSQAFGEQYNIVSFDPRGVNNSGPSLDCFAGNPGAKSAFTRLHITGVTNTSSPSFLDQYYSSSIYGEWCNHAIQNESLHGYYVTTPAVARDLLHFTEAEARRTGQSPSDAKLWSYGVSYGTVIGTTFASMFPDRVGRMVLDGVLDAEQYYSNQWTDNVAQMDEAMEEFANLCHLAGPGKCSFWGSSSTDIMARIDVLVQQLKEHPVAISGVQSLGLPKLVTHSDLKALFLDALYLPLVRFPQMGDALHKLETEGDVSALVDKFDGLNSTSDSRLAIMCADSYRRNKLTTIEDFERFVDYTTSESKYIGDLWPIFQANVLCRSFQPELPDSMVAQDPISAIDKPTSFPILFASTSIDPLSPLESARKMSSLFAGSTVLVQEAVGHTILSQMGSECYIRHVRAYFQGQLPPSNTTCSAQHVPFMAGSP